MRQKRKKITKKPQESRAGIVLLSLGGIFGLAVFISTVAAGTIKGSFGENYPFPLGTGEFGDSFGFATSLFTGLAFLGLLLAVNIQRNELAEFREERKDTQEILDNQTSEASKSRTETELRNLQDQFFFILGAIETRRNKTRSLLDAETAMKISNRFISKTIDLLSTSNAKKIDHDVLLELSNTGGGHIKAQSEVSFNAKELLSILSITQPEGIPDESIQPVFDLTKPVSIASNDCAKSLILLNAALLDQYINASTSTPSGRDFTAAFAALLEQSVDVRYRHVFTLHILHYEFCDLEYDEFLYNFIPSDHAERVKESINQIRILMRNRRVLDGRIVSTDLKN